MNRAMMNGDAEMVAILRTISRSLSVQALAVAPLQFESNTDKMTYLEALGHSPEDISAILGVGLKNVTNRLGEKRSSGGGRLRKKRRGN